MVVIALIMDLISHGRHRTLAQQGLDEAFFYTSTEFPPFYQFDCIPLMIPICDLLRFSAYNNKYCDVNHGVHSIVAQSYIVHRRTLLASTPFPQHFTP